MTGLHLSTVGMSVRNALVMLGVQRGGMGNGYRNAFTIEEILAYFEKVWPVRGLEAAEVAGALLELELRGMAHGYPGAGDAPPTFEASDGRFYRGRSREQAGMSEDDHWQGWTT